MIPLFPPFANCKANFPIKRSVLSSARRASALTARSARSSQLVPQARHEFLLVNDSDITVSPHYLERVMAHFAPPQPQPNHQPPKSVGLVTALYRGRMPMARSARDSNRSASPPTSCPSVLVARMIEGGLRYMAFGSTLAVSREALQKIGGFEALIDSSRG